MEGPGVGIVLPGRFCIAAVYFGSGHNDECVELDHLVWGIFFLLFPPLPKQFKFKNFGLDPGSGSNFQFLAVLPQDFL